MSSFQTSPKHQNAFMKPIQEETHSKIKVYAPQNEEADLDLDFNFGSRRNKNPPGASNTSSRSEDAEGGSILNHRAEEPNGDEDSMLSDEYSYG